MHLRKRVSVVRSLPSYSLGFQQSVEIESSECCNVHFSLALPHQAWVAGVPLACRFSVSPLDKNVVVQNVDISVVEMFRAASASATGWEDRSRVLSRRQHSFVKRQESIFHSYWPFSRARDDAQDTPLSPTAERSILLDLPIPASAQPSHSIAPIRVTHHIKCKITVTQPHGPSYINCTLPIKLLDARLRGHVQAATHRSRAAFFGFGNDGTGEDDLAAHVRDRVLTSPAPSRRASSEIPSYQESASGYMSGIPPLDALKELPQYTI
jgi:hypothetical protein